MTFSGHGSYRKDPDDCEEYIATQYVFDKLEGGINVLKY